MSSLISAGIGLAIVAFGARYVVRAMPKLADQMSNTIKNMDTQSFATNKYYKGGFDAKMTKREAALILSISSNAAPDKVKIAFKKLMTINHPDKGGSPYLSAKIGEAKEVLEKK